MVTVEVEESRECLLCVVRCVPCEAWTVYEVTSIICVTSSSVSGQLSVAVGLLISRVVVVDERGRQRANHIVADNEANNENT